MPEPTAPEPTLPPRPEMPGADECCHSDCALCVFTLYERRLERWEQAVAEAEQNPPPV